METGTTFSAGDTKDDSTYNAMISAAKEHGKGFAPADLTFKFLSSDKIAIAVRSACEAGLKAIFCSKYEEHPFTIKLTAADGGKVGISQTNSRVV